jgi:hypothetical protein
MVLCAKCVTVILLADEYVVDHLRIDAQHTSGDDIVHGRALQQAHVQQVLAECAALIGVPQHFAILATASLATLAAAVEELECCTPWSVY